MAAKKTTHGIEELTTMYKSFFIDLPLAGTRWGLGLGGEKETIEAAWKGYDAAVRFASNTVDGVYRTPWFGELTAQSLDNLLRFQQVGDALAKTVLTGLSQAAGLPSAAQIRTLQAEVQTLREEVQSLAAALPVQTSEKVASPRLDEQPKARPAGNKTASIRRVAA